MIGYQHIAFMSVRILISLLFYSETHSVNNDPGPDSGTDKKLRIELFRRGKNDKKRKHYNNRNDHQNIEPDSPYKDCRRFDILHSHQK